MKTIHTIDDIQKLTKQIRNQRQSIAFVPTMGNLHEGHLSLIKKAHNVADKVIVSIYVNQLQFGQNEDYKSYPRTLEKDLLLLQEHNTDIAYCPTSSEILPDGYENHTSIKVSSLDGMHCGKTRPNFFTGIATIVTKLFNIINPDYSVFGEKDYQQLLIIKKTVSDLLLPVKIISVPTARSKTGLALSSRNGYLSKEEIKNAPILYQTLRESMDTIMSGNYQYNIISRNANVALANAGMQPDYYNVVNRNNLLPATDSDTKIIILAAVTFGKARLIDNIQIDL